jgi:Protein of unknown function (DUF1239).
MKRYLIALLWTILFLPVYSESKNVVLEQCDVLSFDKSTGAQYQVLKGNVRFRHESALMFCDSAYFYDSNNSFDAFGHVKVIDKNSTMTSDKMFYDGNSTLMKIRNNVVVNNEGTMLTTNSLDFIRNKNYGYYVGGGKIVDPEYELVSQKGYYYPDTKTYFFKTDVVLTSPDYSIQSDSLQFNNETGKMVLIGPSVVKEKDYTVYTSNAWMNKQTKIGKLYDYSVIVSKDGQRLTADSIFYDMNTEYAKAYHNIEMQDSSQKAIGRGNFAEFWKKSPSRGYITDHSYVIDYSEQDTLFLAGDTIYALELDSSRSEVRAYRHVKFYRDDMQGKCDSMVYSSDDSILSMYGTPILWSEESQLTGEQINIYMKDQKADLIHITKNAMIVQFEGEDMYNQLSGKESKAYLKNNKLKRVDMLGDAISIYYSKDERDALVGVNKAKGNAMSIFMKSNKKVDKIVMTPDSEGILYPPLSVPEGEKRLSKFKWLEDQRPKSKNDIFIK